MQIQEFTFSINCEKDCNCGSLIAIEELKNIPFKIKRVYFIYGVDSNVVRGKHAHLYSNQILIAIKGSCEIVLDDGKSKKNVLLNSPTKGILQKNMVWGEMKNFSKESILMVLSDHLYNQDDYIRDYNRFLKLLKTNETNYEHCTI